MCIRDSKNHGYGWGWGVGGLGAGLALGYALNSYQQPQVQYCLLYTSDAADERSSVDLGGRRIIKKKTTVTRTHARSTLHHTWQLPSRPHTTPRRCGRAR